MAVFLADVLNGLDSGESLPPAGEQHQPVRFQLTHDATGLTSGAAVVYVHGFGGRIVAQTNDDDRARLIARILNHVDYPMQGEGTLIPRLGALVSAPSALPEPTLATPRSARRRLAVTAYVLAIALPIVLVVALLAVARWPYAVAAVVGYLLFIVAVRAVVARL
ncbi:MAG TPA: hypothetical protein VKR79_09450 [Gaiellaceae bacterium]|nr:hypothetical protein [Gaiellaceae bacterium]